ncbi:uncharacterized protein [Dermacentor andersoni]|uniref:uncharacterized protein n=1 Tax=Dermacentor andersoni TaxID=34620 RepID=UPI002417710E|nr:ribonuclease Y-like [Dermacentor andersoni]
MRPDPVMDLVTLVAIMLGAIMLFVLLWLLVRKYSVAPVAEPPRGDETLADGASSHRRASKTSQQRPPVGAGADGSRGASSAPERGLPDAAHKPSIATGRTAPLAPSSGPDAVPPPGVECSGATDLPATPDERPKKHGAKAAAAAVAASVPKQAGNAAAGEKRPESSAPESLDHSVVRNKPKASSGWVFAVTGDKLPDQPSRTNSAEDANAAATGTGKRSSYEEEQDAAGIGRTSGGQAADQTAHEENSGMASAELTTTKEHRRHKKKSKKQQREGGGVGSASAGSPPEVGADADTTTTTKRKHKSRRGKDSKCVGVACATTGANFS